jgi:antitoxin component of RelBE/YafQ-DinJ toxin-antitoxin module
MPSELTAITFKLPAELKDEINVFSEQMGLSQSNFIRLACKNLMRTWTRSTEPFGLDSDVALTLNHQSEL